MSRMQLVGSQGSEPAPSPEEVRAYLRTLLARSVFNASERNKRFLSYVVDETLEGRADRIKAYSIAIAAFDRSEDFDPLTDPIVRIEASRLRRALEHYYLTDGRSDPICIDIPKGAYVATFEYRSLLSRAAAAPPPERSTVAPQSRPTVSPSKRRWSRTIIAGTIAALIVLVGALATAWQYLRPDGAAVADHGPSILVLPFETVSTDPDHAFIARGLTYELINELTRFDDLFVFGPETAFDAGSWNNPNRLSDTVDADYVLSGSVSSTGGTVRVSTLLSDSRTHQYVWSAQLERNLTTASLLAVETDIAAQVAGAVAQPYGVVFDRTAARIAEQPAVSLVSYECVVRFRQYWRDYNQQEYDTVRDCLERTLETDARYARAYSSLALLDIDAYRFGFDRHGRVADPLKEAVSLARRSIELEPSASDGYLALSMSYWFSKDIKQSLDVAQRGLALNPHNTDLLAELGFRYAFLAKWDQSRPLIAEAFARNPQAPSGYHIATFLDAYMHEDYQAALREALQVRAPFVLYGHVARAAAYAQLGDASGASAAVAEITKLDPAYGSHAVADFAKRNLDPTIARALVDGLGKAGLQLSPSGSGG